MHDERPSNPGRRDQRRRGTQDAWVRVAHAEVGYVLGVARVPHVFLKGPALADWLYDRDLRTFVDVDVLVPPALLKVAIEALSAHGYEDLIAGTLQGETADHSHPLRRADGVG